VVQYVALEDTVWHCKGANANGIGIEHAGNTGPLGRPGTPAYKPPMTAGDWAGPDAQAMLEISAEMAALLCHQYHIPPERAQFKRKTDPTVVTRGFTGHVDVPGHGSHTDPGSAFP